MSDTRISEERYHEVFTQMTAVPAEGARVGIATCRICGAAVMFDSRETENSLALHEAWHRKEQGDE